MRLGRIAIGGLTAVALAAGSAGAIAATNGDARNEEQAVLDDAAKRLDVTPERLRSALSGAQDAQIDERVRAGELTQEQADAIKQRRVRNGRVLVPGHGRGHHGTGGRGGRPQRFEDLATALGLSKSDLRTRLRDGETVTEIARAEGRGLASVKREVRASRVKRLDAAVKAGRLTDAQRDAMLAHLDEHIDRLGEWPDGRFGRKPPGHRRDDHAHTRGADGAAGVQAQPGHTFQ